jgi:hypothetical protein
MFGAGAVGVEILSDGHWSILTRSAAGRLQGANGAADSGTWSPARYPQDNLMKVTFADGTGRRWTYAASFFLTISTQVVFSWQGPPGDTQESPPSPSALLEFVLVRTSQPVAAPNQ